MSNHDTAITIRRATGDDLEAVLAIGRVTWPATYEHLAGPEYVAMGLAKWWTADATTPAIRAGRVLVAEVHGDVVGMASYGPRREAVVVWKLYVLPEMQGHGVGSALFDELLARVSERTSVLEANYTEGNVGAQHFYESRGFTETTREATGDGLPRIVWLRRELGSPEAESAESEPVDPPKEP